MWYDDGSRRGVIIRGMIVMVGMHNIWEKSVAII